MSDFLLELRSEEIPARMQAGARANLEKLFREQMAAAGVAFGAITVWSTPRRLALIARGLPDESEARTEEKRGPKLGAPDAAIEGFARSVGRRVVDLEARDGYTWAVSTHPGLSTYYILAEAIPAIIRAFPWPKSQRWGAASITTESLRWVRPLSGIVAIFGDELVECEIGGITSGYATMGHRFHAPGEITIGGAGDYQDKLRACHVIVDHAEREAIIREGAKAAASAAGLVLVEDEGLVIENAGLTEWPVPLLGRFDAEYLEVPPEVIQLTARTNQKYFVCEDGGKLANAFICTANITASDGGAAIVAGNRKVLAARLSDARFFWQQDRKKTLEQHAEGLSRITFHEKLGTVADKVERVAKLARWLCEEGIVKPSPLQGRGRSGEAAEGVGSVDQALRLPDKPHPNPSPEGEGLSLATLAEQAARLCKADLVTEMVGEFPELQGLMGSYYARAEGLPGAVADAIRDHYKPVGQGDDVPTAPVTVAVALADKLDSIAMFFWAEEMPSGSRDPFALRRSALGAISLIFQNQIRISLRRVFTEILWRVLHDWDNHYNSILRIESTDRSSDGAFFAVGEAVRDYEHIRSPENILEVFTTPEFPLIILVVSDLDGGGGELSKNEYLNLVRFWLSDPNVAVSRLIAFFADRLKVQQREAGVRHDLIDAVFALGGEDDLVRLLARVYALQAFVASPDGVNLLAGYKRAANILKKEEFTPGAINPAPEPAEAALIAALAEAGPRAAAAVEAEDFAAAMLALASLRAPIDAFFDSVTVNDSDPAKRSARLSLLAQFRSAVHQVADFSKIEG